MDEHDYKRFSLWRTWDIPHYYGDYVRQCFIAAAAISLLTIPMWGDLLPFGTLVQVGSAVVLVLLAGLTNPHGRVVLFLDATAAGLGLIFIEAAAINFYQTQSFMLFAAREAVALLLLLAFYFSVKTVRAMSMRQVGHPFRVGEFDEKDNEK
ncbi:hypothetical protein A2943_02865 [Candidatus Adlerbacteria bacterium RIFCSPLOWO2_01_FULL_51_16]|uniref:Uncharacterized protein n=1 Tax=Candidatus Adlerbacteria bacterium RIFCSPLOWO2_01_FULL_51_16 TaxID=1797243 RepID=A0A1F4XGF3_9BACT|nr:MAG: hypothetical protein A2943_02865 [Candidatus Adlerbacteria bacterium RIFCSPLOWO2_01_FULL_51_16]